MAAGEEIELWWTGVLMGQDYSTVSEKSEMGVYVCAFLLLRKTSMEQHLLPLGCWNHKVEVTLSKCLGCSLSDKKISVSLVIQSTLLWPVKHQVVSTVKCNRDHLVITSWQGFLILLWHISTDNMKERYGQVRPRKYGKVFQVYNLTIFHTHCQPSVCCYLFAFKPTPAVGAPAAAVKFEGFTKVSRMKVKWTQLGLVFFLILSLVMTGCFFWQYQMPKLLPGKTKHCW